MKSSPHQYPLIQIQNQNMRSSKINLEDKLINIDELYVAIAWIISSSFAVQYIHKVHAFILLKFHEIYNRSKNAYYINRNSFGESPWWSMLTRIRLELFIIINDLLAANDSTNWQLATDEYHKNLHIKLVANMLNAAVNQYCLNST